MRTSSSWAVAWLSARALTVKTWSRSIYARVSTQALTAKRWSVSTYARISPQVSKVGTWPSAVRARMSTQVLGEGALAAMLLAALAFAPRDGVPVDDNFVWPADNRLAAATVEQPSFGLTLPGVSSLSDRARAAGQAFTNQALVPTAPPAQLLIPAMRVHRPVEGVGVDRWGVMELPVNGWNAGWFKSGPTPGAPGDAVIEGHAGFPDQPMLFGKLATLKQGDKIIVVLADGSQRLFLVQSMAVLNVGSAPPGFGEPFGPPRLTLITCTGHFNADQKFYSQRLVVEASYAGVI